MTDDRTDIRIVLTILAITSLTILSGATLAPSLPGIRDHFVSVTNVEVLTRLLLTIPALVIAVFAPLVGWVMDRFGRRNVILVAIASYAVVGTAGLYLNSLHTLVLSRAILGLSVAGTLTGATTLIGDHFRGSERNRILGLQGGFTALSGVVFLLAGGVLAEISWRIPFAMYFLALPVVPLAWLAVRETLPSRTRRDAGIAPAAGPAAAVADALPESETLHMTGRAVALVVAICTVSYFVQIAFYMMPVQLPFFLAELGETRPSYAGIALSTMTLCAAAVAINFKRIRARLDRAVILAMSLTGLGAGVFLVSRAQSFAQVIPANIVIGLAMGLNYTNLAGWLMARTPDHVRGRVVGALMTSVFIGQFSSPLVTQPLIAHGGLSFGYQWAGIGVLVIAAAVWVTAAIKPRTTRD